MPRSTSTSSTFAARSNPSIACPCRRSPGPTWPGLLAGLDCSIPVGSSLCGRSASRSIDGMELHFECTQCGRCCHDLRLTLSVAEACAWAGRGHQVDLLTEAWPWPDDGASSDAGMAWRKATSFAVRVGDVPFRINLRLVARHE